MGLFGGMTLASTNMYMYVLSSCTAMNYGIFRQRTARERDKLAEEALDPRSDKGKDNQTCRIRSWREPEIALPDVGSCHKMYG